jgi:glycosyltransferase involved in cell wall biosynthesis
MNNSKKNKSICCVILNYNNRLGLIKNLNDLLNQKIKFDQIIIVDDCSTDGSYLYLKKINKNKIFKLVQNKRNIGINKSFNKILKFVKCDYIFAASTDDKYSKKIVFYFKKIVKNFSPKYGELGLIFGNAIAKYSNSKTIIQNVDLKNDTFLSSKDFQKLYLTSRISFIGGNIILKTSLIKKYNGYAKRLKWYADWFLYFAISLNYNIAYSNKIFIKKIISNKSYSSGSKNVSNEKQNILFLLDFLKQKKLYEKFKSLAILPNYNFMLLAFLIYNKNFRNYLSFKLIKKILLNSLSSNFASFIPMNIKKKIRLYLQF